MGARCPSCLRQRGPQKRSSLQQLPPRVRRRAAAGLSVRLDEGHHYDLEVADGQASVIARIGPLRQVVATRTVPARVPSVTQGSCPSSIGTPSASS